MGDCSICLCELNEESGDIYGLPCSHSFHSDCIGPWANKNNTCPLCRTQIIPVVPLARAAPVGRGYFGEDSGEYSESDSDEEKSIDYGDESDFEEEYALAEGRAVEFYERSFTFRVSSSIVVSI